MRPGSIVEVRSRFDGGWVRGFQVETVEDTTDGEACLVRRTSDGTVLPVSFPAGDLRELPTTGQLPPATRSRQTA
jgi:hypothetical protein